MNERMLRSWKLEVGSRVGNRVKTRVFSKEARHVFIGAEEEQGAYIR